MYLSINIAVFLNYDDNFITCGLHIYIYICTYTLIYVFIHLHTYIHTCMHACIHTCIYIYIYTHMLFLCAQMGVSISVCRYTDEYMFWF